MAKVGTAEYDVEISRAKVQAEVDAASRQIEQGLGGSAQKVSREFSNAARVAVAGFAGLAGARLLGDSIQAASNLAEQQSKVGVVFGASVKQVEAFAETAAQSFGQSERAALQATGTFGNLFVSVGIGQQQAAEMSVTLAKLAADLASFNNVPIDDVFTALRAGLVGEQEPLRRLGVNLNEVTLKAKALELGLDDGKGVLDANAKAQAAYALILEQTGTAQGDFARTSDNLANQQRILSAEYENAKAQLGEGLVPAAKLAVGVLDDLAKAVQAIPAPLLAGGVAIGSLVVGVGLLAPVIRSGVTELKAFVGAASGRTAATVASTAAINAETTALTANTAAQSANNAAAGSGVAQAGRLSTALTNAGGAAALLSKGTAVAGAGLLAFGGTTAALNYLSRARTDVDELAKALERLGQGAGSAEDAMGALADGEDIDDLVAQALRFGSVKDILDDVLSFQPGQVLDTRQAQKELGELDKALTELYAQDPGQALTAYAALSAEIIRQGGSVSDLVALLPDFTGAVEDASAAEDIAANSTEGRTKALQEQAAELEKQFDLERSVADAREDTIDAVKDLQEAEAAARGDSDEYRRAQESIADATKDLTQARQEAAGNSEAYRDAQRGVADAERSLADAQRSTQRAQEDLTRARADAKEQLEDLAFAAEGASLAEERATLRLEDARAELDRVRNDPRSTERDRREAELSIREAELALKEAQDRNEDSAGALSEANAKGVEGSDAVVAAKERVEAAIQSERDARERLGEATRRVSQVIVDAQQRVVEAEERLADANADAIEIIEDAKERHREATKRVEDAVLDQAEAERDLAEVTLGATESTGVYIASLEGLAGFLEPGSKFRQDLDSYITDLQTLQTINGPPTNFLGIPQVGAEGSGLPSGPRSGRGDVTVNVTTDANPKEIADALMWDN